MNKEFLEWIDRENQKQKYQKDDIKTKNENLAFSKIGAMSNPEVATSRFILNRMQESDSDRSDICCLIDVVFQHFTGD